MGRIIIRLCGEDGDDSGQVGAVLKLKLKTATVMHYYWLHKNDNGYT